MAMSRPPLSFNYFSRPSSSAPPLPADDAQALILEIGSLLSAASNIVPHLQATTTAINHAESSAISEEQAER